MDTMASAPAAQFTREVGKSVYAAVGFALRTQQGPTLAVSLPANQEERYPAAGNWAFALLLLLLSSWVYLGIRRLLHQANKLCPDPLAGSALDRLLDTGGVEADHLPEQ